MGSLIRMCVRTLTCIVIAVLLFGLLSYVSKLELNAYYSLNELPLGMLFPSMQNRTSGLVARAVWGTLIAALGCLTVYETGHNDIKQARLAIAVGFFVSATLFLSGLVGLVLRMQAQFDFTAYSSRIEPILRNLYFVFFHFTDAVCLYTGLVSMVLVLGGKSVRPRWFESLAFMMMCIAVLFCSMASLFELNTIAIDAGLSVASGAALLDMVGLAFRCVPVFIVIVWLAYKLHERSNTVVSAEES